MASTKDVAIVDMSFQPAEVSVAAGDTVRWTNMQSMAHTVTADDGSFDSGLLGENQSFSHTFSQPGTFGYHCSIHAFMTGTVDVG
jgi:plastocyanin